MPLCRRFINLEKFLIKSQDRNINMILDQCLPFMPTIQEIYIDSEAPRAAERFEIIRRNASNLKNLTIAEKFSDIVNQYFANNVIVEFVRN